MNTEVRANRKDIFHGLEFIYKDEYDVPGIKTYCDIEEIIDEEGTKNLKDHFVTFDNKKVNCEDCLNTEEFKDEAEK